MGGVIYERAMLGLQTLFGGLRFMLGLMQVHRGLGREGARGILAQHATSGISRVLSSMQGGPQHGAALRGLGSM